MAASSGTNLLEAPPGEAVATPRYSFLLVNYNMWGLAERCLREIEASVADEEYEILLADNSTDGEFRAPPDCTKAFRRLSLIYLEQNNGWVDVLNRLIPLASGDFVVVMHPDVRIPPGCFAALRLFLESRPLAAMVSPAMVYPDGTRCRLRLHVPLVGAELKRVVNKLCHIGVKRAPLTPEIFWNHEGDVEAETLMSVMMMIRREALRQMIPVNPQISTYFANDWLCASARRLGWSCHYTAAITITHCERHSERTLYSSSESSSYKRTAMAPAAIMFQDQFLYLRDFYAWPTLLALRLLATIEFGLLLLSYLRPRVPERSVLTRQCWKALRAIWRKLPARAQPVAADAVRSAAPGRSLGVRRVAGAPSASPQGQGAEHQEQPDAALRNGY